MTVTALCSKYVVSHLVTQEVNVQRTVMMYSRGSKSEDITYTFKVNFGH